MEKCEKRRLGRGVRDQEEGDGGNRIKEMKERRRNKMKEWKGRTIDNDV